MTSFATDLHPNNLKASHDVIKYSLKSPSQYPQSTPYMLLNTLQLTKDIIISTQ